MFSPILPRVYCGSGVHRAPTVALSAVGALILHCPTAKVVDAFPMSLVGVSESLYRMARNWRPEAFRLQNFLLSGPNID